jgi:hypothetical protein
MDRDEHGAVMAGAAKITVRELPETVRIAGRVKDAEALLSACNGPIARNDSTRTE